MKRNPFFFGEGVTGKSFTDRVNEIRRLTAELRGGYNVFLISPRRYGKTSLITIEKMMRACFQHHHNVAYLFAGSKRHLLHSMVSDPNRAFYKLGDIMNLQKIEPDEMMEFLQKQFSKGPIEVRKDVLDYVLEVSENVPYNVQYLCHHVWNWCLEAKNIEKEDVMGVLDNIIAEQSVNYRLSHIKFHKARGRRLYCNMPTTDNAVKFNM